MKMNSIAVDALNLFTVKTDPIVQAMQVAIGRISTGLTSCLVDWRNFLDDVGQIRSKLIGNPKHGALVPYIKELIAAEACAFCLLNDVRRPVEARQLHDSAATLIQLGWDQVAAVAATTAIYVTALGTGAPITKKQALQTVKAKILHSAAKVPTAIVTLLDQRIEEQDANIKATPKPEPTGEPTGRRVGPKAKAKRVPARGRGSG